MELVTIFLAVLLIAGILAVVLSYQPGRHTHSLPQPGRHPFSQPGRRVRSYLMALRINPSLYRYPSPTPGPGEAMEDLASEIKENRRRAFRSSHRPRP